MKRYWMRKIPLIILLVAAGIFLFGWIVMLLWNATLPSLTGAEEISFWQATGLLVLSKILFGGFRGGWGGRHHWKNGWQEKWSRMSEEEKAKFREKCKSFFPGKPMEKRENE